MTALPEVEVDDAAGADTWLALVSADLELDLVNRWVVLPRCGAVVVFTGTARDHAGHRTDVTHLFYEAYEQQVRPRMSQLATTARQQWPDLGRIALHHRTGIVPVGQAAVIVAVSAPHRGEAFDAARFLIDEAKSTLPIWKRERWPGGDEWVDDGTLIDEIGAARG